MQHRYRVFKKENNCMGDLQKLSVRLARLRSILEMSQW